MTGFSHFLRFAAPVASLPGRGMAGAVNRHTPTGRHAVLPFLSGDEWRVLLPKSDLLGSSPDLVDVVLMPDSTAYEPALSPVVGQVRFQQSETYIEFTLTVDALPAANQQWAIVRSNGETVFGTFRPSGAYPSLDHYLTELTQKLEAYPHAPIFVRRHGRSLIVRVYRSPRFDPSEQEIQGWRIGLGKVAANGYNTNRPAVRLGAVNTVTLPAQDQYRLVVGDDLLPGNVFSLTLPGPQQRTYVVQSGDKPAQVLRGLGLTADTLMIAANATVQVSVLAGSVTDNNRNQPQFSPLFSQTVSGQDRYTLLIANVQAGNVFSLTLPGQSTLVHVATDTDTPATIGQVLAPAGYVAVPTGTRPTCSVQAGSMMLPNTNVPQFFLTDKTAIPARTLDRYRLTIANDIIRGNQFVVGSATVTAGLSDTPATIAAKLGFTSHPFTIDQTPGSPEPDAYALRGPLLTEPDNVAPVRLTGAPTQRRPTQCVLVVRLPDVASSTQLYRLGLYDRSKGVLLGLSNPLKWQATPADTLLLRWGYGAGPGRVYHYQYDEDGLAQQIRIPAYLGPVAQRVEESQYRSLYGEAFVADMRVNYARRLITSMQPAAFHHALLLALKHPVLTVDGLPLRALGEYREDTPTLVANLFQASIDLTLIEATLMRDDRQTALASPAQTTAVVGRLAGAEFLTLTLRSGVTEYALHDGLRLAPAEYTLQVVCPDQAHDLAVYVNDAGAYAALLTANRKNLSSPIRLAPGDVLTVRARPVTASISSETPLATMPTMTTTQTGLPELAQAGPDFTNDFSTDFTIH